MKKKHNKKKIRNKGEVKPLKKKVVIEKDAKLISDFVGIDDKRKRVCVCGHHDNFTAIYVAGRWKSGYPEFDDLMDNYDKLKDVKRSEQYSIDARTAIALLDDITSKIK